MKMHRIYLIAMIVLLISACSSPHSHMGDYRRGAMAVTDEAPLPRLSDDELLKRVNEAATPGPAHAELQALAGEWRTESRWWKEAGAAPDISAGTASHRWILGNRFIHEDVRGQFLGQPYEGLGLLGYDNVAKEYTSTWTDSMGTGIMISRGTLDSGTRTINMVGKYSCPITRTERSGRMTLRILDNNRHVFEMYDRGSDGREFKSMEVAYNRVK